MVQSLNYKNLFSATVARVSHEQFLIGENKVVLNTINNIEIKWEMGKIKVSFKCQESLLLHAHQV